MRHLNSGRKLGRSSSHRKALMTSLVCNLIEEKRIKTTLAKAKEARSLAEKMVTMARKGTLAARRNAISLLRRPERVSILFDDIVPKFEGRQGGYCRIMKLGRRTSDGSEMALLEWVGIEAPVKTKKKTVEEKDEAK